MSGACEMLKVAPGPDGMGVEWPCTELSVGITEDKVRVCAGCAEGMLSEGFRVDFDAAPSQGSGR